MGDFVFAWFAQSFYKNHKFFNLLPALTPWQRRRMPHLLVGFFLLPVKVKPSYDYRDTRIK
jgi:hypothetical protein